MIVQTRLSAPANVQSALHVRLAPFHDAAQLVPVFHLFKRHFFHRRSRDDEAVEVAILYIVKGLVKREQMLLGNILRLVRFGVDQLQFHLQRGVAEQTRKLGLGLDLFGHQIQQKDL